MPAPVQRRLAGFRFEVQPPPLPETLPRMDIAAFVGFAAAGPLDEPVLCEAVDRFQQIFGDDIVLASDPITSEPVYACLGPAVRQFFRNGGQRCWVIRVARQAESDYFPLPGLLEFCGSNLRPAFAKARSPGSWFDQFECATALSVQVIAAVSPPDANGFVARLRTGLELAAGDLVRFNFPDQGVQCFVEILGLAPILESLPDPTSHPFQVQSRPLASFEILAPETVGIVPCEATWTRLPKRGKCEPVIVSATGWLKGTAASPLDAPPDGELELLIPDPSPPADAAFTPPAGSWLQLVTADGPLWFMVESIAKKSASSTSLSQTVTALVGSAYRRRSDAAAWPASTGMIAEKLTFELRARAGENDAVVLSDLGFAWAQPRCWSALPDDESLFAPDDLVGKAAPSDDLIHTELVVEAQENPTGGGRFPVAGTGNTDAVYLPLAAPFLPDPYLPAEYGADDELTRSGLRNFDSALFLDPELIESYANTLLADADFVRYQEGKRLTGIHTALEIDEATLIAVPDAIHAGWDPVVPPPPAPPVPSSALPHPSWGLDDSCDYEQSPPTGFAPRFDKFLDCALRELEPPILSGPTQVEPPGTFELDWTSADTDATFILQESTQPDFSDAVTVYQGPQSERTFLGKAAGDYYYRVREVLAQETSNWSNGIVVRVAPETRYVARVAASASGAAAGKFDLSTLLDVHRSLLRLSAARGDMLSVLALPRQFRVDECLNYLRVLKSPKPEAASLRAATLPLNGGETTALSYGAVYHPWLVTREDNGLIYSPPDGAATGLMAARALERGAWIAPANVAFGGVVALDPPLDDDFRLELLQGQLNQLTQEPAGFLALNEDTLSLDDDLRPINVRRLLSLLRRAALKRGATYVFEPNSASLRRLVQHAFESLLDQLFVRGAFSGATRATSYQVVTDASLNTDQTMNLGQFRVDLKVAPSTPMSFVTIRLVQTGESGVTTEIL